MYIAALTYKHNKYLICFKINSIVNLCLIIFKYIIYIIICTI